MIWWFRFKLVESYKESNFSYLYPHLLSIYSYVCSSLFKIPSCVFYLLFISFLIYVCIFVLIKEFLSAIFFNILFTHWYSQYLSTYIYFNSKLNKKCPKLERKISTWKVCFKLELKILNYNFFFFFLTSS